MAGINIRKVKELKTLLDSIEAGADPEEEEDGSVDRQELIDNIRGFNNIVKSIHEASTIFRESVGKIAEWSKGAGFHVMKESEKIDKFSSGIIEKNAESLKDISEEFVKVGGEMKDIHDKVLTLTDDVGTLLNRYYQIDDIETVKPVESKQK